MNLEQGNNIQQRPLPCWKECTGSRRCPVHVSLSATVQSGAGLLVLRNLLGHHLWGIFRMPKFSTKTFLTGSLFNPNSLAVILIINLQSIHTSSLTLCMLASDLVEGRPDFGSSSRSSCSSLNCLWHYAMPPEHFPLNTSFSMGLDFFPHCSQIIDMNWIHSITEYTSLELETHP